MTLLQKLVITTTVLWETEQKIVALLDSFLAKLVSCQSLTTSSACQQGLMKTVFGDRSVSTALDDCCVFEDGSVCRWLEVWPLDDYVIRALTCVWSISTALASTAKGDTTTTTQLQRRFLISPTSTSPTASTESTNRQSAGTTSRNKNETNKK